MSFIPRSVVLLFLLSAAHLLAGDPGPGEAMVEIRARFVRATEAQFAAATEPDSGSSVAVLDEDRSRKTLAALEAAGGRMLADLRTVTLSGREIVAQSIRELRYPTEFERSESGKAFPTAFETRNVGIQLVARPEFGSGGRLKMKVHPSVTEFLGFIDYTGKEKPAATGQSFDKRLDAPLSSGGVWQPLFHTVDFQSETELASGQTLVLGGAPAASPSSQETGKSAERLYVFITATLLK